MDIFCFYKITQRLHNVRFFFSGEVCLRFVSQGNIEGLNEFLKGKFKMADNSILRTHPVYSIKCPLCLESFSRWDFRNKHLIKPSCKQLKELAGHSKELQELRSMVHNLEQQVEKSG